MTEVGWRAWTDGDGLLDLWIKSSSHTHLVLGSTISSSPILYSRDIDFSLLNGGNIAVWNDIDGDERDEIVVSGTGVSIVLGTTFSNIHGQ